MTVLQVYAEPIGYWRNYYNLFDFAVLFVSVAQNILTTVSFEETQLSVLRVVRGMCEERSRCASSWRVCKERSHCA